MDRDEALRLLRGGQEGVLEWNHRISRGEETPNLHNAFLINADLRGVDLRGAYLVGVILCEADLHHANLAGSLLSGADLRGADLRRAQLRHANLNKAIFGNTLVSCDLSKTGGLDTVVHASRSIVDIHSLLFFRGELPVTFLRGCGLGEEDIAHFHRRALQPDHTTSCFICHGSSEATLAGRLHHDLQSVGIRCWKWNHETEICEELLGGASPALRIDDKVVLVASRQSLTSEPVNREIGEIVDEEARRAELASRGKVVGPSRILLTVRVDNFMFEQTDDGRPLWDHPHREAVTGQAVVDAVGWDTDPRKYAAARDRLIRALKSTDTSDG